MTKRLEDALAELEKGDCVWMELKNPNPGCHCSYQEVLGFVDEVTPHGLKIGQRKRVVEPNSYMDVVASYNADQIHDIAKIPFDVIYRKDRFTSIRQNITNAVTIVCEHGEECHQTPLETVHPWNLFYESGPGEECIQRHGKK